MSQAYYSRRERDDDYEQQDSTAKYAKLYQRAQRAARNGSSFSPPASPTYEFSRQRTWPGSNVSGSGGGGGGSYEERERGIPIRGGGPHHSNRDRDRDRDNLDWQPSSSPRTPRGGPGSTLGFGRRDRGSGGGSGGDLLSESPRHESSPRHEPPRSSPQQRERDRILRERERERDRDRDREDREAEEREHDRELYRRRLRRETAGYSRRLRAYLQPVLQSQQATEHALEVFAKLDKDARYLARSAGVLLESLAAVADDIAQSTEGGNGTGLDDPGTDSEFTEEEEDESSVLEEEDDSDSEMGGGGGGGGGAYHPSDSEDSDDRYDDDNYHTGGGGMPNFSRRPSLGGSVLGSGGRRRSSVSQKNGGSVLGSKGGKTSSTGTGGGGGAAAGSTATPPFMNWAGFRPYALSKDAEGVSDRRKSFLALTQIISVNMLSSLGVDTNGTTSNSRSGSNRLSTRGLLSELLRVLQPRDYRAYYRASARVLLLPDTGVQRHPEELTLESLERQLLGTAKFAPILSAGVSTATAPMMACLTYSSGAYGSITLYRLEMAPSREGADWPRRITPVSAMTAVPKELLRRTARAMPPSRRTVLKMHSSAGGGSTQKERAKEKTGTGKNARLRWVSLPADTVAVPGLGYSPNVDRTSLSPSFCEALAIEPEDLKIAPGTSANIVNATVPAMLAWLHVRAAYLTGLEFEGTEIQRGSSGSKDAGSGSSAREAAGSFSSKDRDRDGDRDRDREKDRKRHDRDRDRDRDDTASTSTATMSQRSRIRRIVRWRRGPAAIDHEGKDPCIVVLHPSRGDWVTAPVYWMDAKE